VVRIAAVLHFAEHTSDAAALPISADTFRAAVRIGDYFVEQESAANRAALKSPALRGAEQLLDWITTDGLAGFTTRDALVTKRGTTVLSDAAKVRAALGVLVEHGYIRKDEGRTGEKGRPSETWSVNPATHAQNAHNPVSVNIVHAAEGAAA
jgi:hypothetical protein